jgi:hypothetical protein
VKLPTPNPFISRVAIKLDSELDRFFHWTDSENTNSHQHIDKKAEDEKLINQALVSAVHAFAVRWLCLQDAESTRESTAAKQARDDFASSIWSQAHQSMYPAMSRPSYRSILALHIFGVTPIPPKNGDKRVSDLCIDVALNQHIKLQSTRKILQQKHDSKSQTSSFPFNLLENIYLQNMAFWFGVMCDTARSITTCQPSILLPGKSRDSTVWTHIEQNVESFITLFQPPGHSRISISDNAGEIILQHATALNKMFWSSVIEVQDAFYRHETHIPTQKLVDSALRHMNRFEDVFGVYLDQCAKEFVLLNEQNQIGYSESGVLISSGHVC